MRKVMPYLGASLSLLAAMWATSAKAQDQSSFKDLDTSHWAYQAVTDLQQKGILLGYPDGYFRGKRTLTRYEFAIALWRALQKVQAQVGPPGPPGAPGEAGPIGPPGMTPEEVAELKALTQEFKNDLAQLGANVKDIQSRLDAMAKDIADIKDYLNHIPKISGEIFAGTRSNRSRYGFLDADGAYIGASQTLTGNVDTVNDVHLNIADRLPGDVKAYVDAVFSNYLSYRSNGYTSLGGPAAANGNGGPEEVDVYQAAVEVPIRAINSSTTVTIGRFKNQPTPLTYWRPNSDSYFDLPWYDDGKWVEDGIKFDSKFGSATTTVFAGSYSSLTSSAVGGPLLNAPAVGANIGPREFTFSKPSGVNDQGQIVPNQSIGTHIGLPLFRFGELGFTIIDFGGGTIVGPVAPFSIPYYNNVVVYGGNVSLKHTGRLRVNAEYAKSVNQVGIGNDASSGQDNEDDNAVIATVGYASQGIGAEIGFQQIDPRFSAPGAWNKIGNWINPTNISGFYGSATYSPVKRLELSLRGDWYEGAHNRVDEDGSGFTRGSNILRGLTGAKYKLNKWFDLSADYEYVAYDFSAAVNPEGNGRANYLEEYITLGIGVNLTPNAHFKLGYQMINNQNVDGSFGGVWDSGQLTGNASVLTSQVSVHF